VKRLPRATVLSPRARGPLPKIFFTQTSAEYWSRVASLLHTDVEGKQDAGVDANVRIYFIAAAQHVFNRRWFLKPGTMPPNPFGGIDQVKMNPSSGSYRRMT